MEHLEAYNRKLLANILPVHVAEHFLTLDKPVDVSNSFMYLHNNNTIKDMTFFFFALVLFLIWISSKVKYGV